jgi:hypothetical protein
MEDDSSYNGCKVENFTIGIPEKIVFSARNDADQFREFSSPREFCNLPPCFIPCRAADAGNVVCKRILPTTAANRYILPKPASDPAASGPVPVSATAGGESIQACQGHSSVISKNR